jgi:hypothetical protein
LILLLIFAAIYPVLDSGRQLWFIHLGGGSDRDDALNIAVNELVNERYPYSLRTYLGNPITPLPGSILLAVPFFLLGNSAYQSFFWLLVLFAVLRSDLGDGRDSLLLCWVMVLLCPASLLEIMSGGDLFANSIFVMIFFLFAFKTIPDDTASLAKKIAVAVLLGIGLSSRPNFMLIVPIFFFAILRSANKKSAIIYTMVACLAFAGITLPFYIVDPPGFSPLHTVGMIGDYKSLPPGTGSLALAVIGIVSILIPIRFKRFDELYVVLSCAVTQALFVFGFAALHAIDNPMVGLEFMNFGLMFVPFGALGFWKYLIGLWKDRADI